MGTFPFKLTVENMGETGAVVLADQVPDTDRATVMVCIGPVHH